MHLSLESPKVSWWESQFQNRSLALLVSVHAENEIYPTIWLFHFFQLSHFIYFWPPHLNKKWYDPYSAKKSGTAMAVPAVPPTTALVPWPELASGMARISQWHGLNQWRGPNKPLIWSESAMVRISQAPFIAGLDDKKSDIFSDKSILGTLSNRKGNKVGSYCYARVLEIQIQLPYSPKYYYIIGSLVENCIG